MRKISGNDLIALGLHRERQHKEPRNSGKQDDGGQKSRVIGELVHVDRDEVDELGPPAFMKLAEIFQNVRSRRRRHEIVPRQRIATAEIISRLRDLVAEYLRVEAASAVVAGR